MKYLGGESPRGAEDDRIGNQPSVEDTICDSLSTNESMIFAAPPFEAQLNLAAARSESI